MTLVVADCRLRRSGRWRAEIDRCAIIPYSHLNCQATVGLQTTRSIAFAFLCRLARRIAPKSSDDAQVGGLTLNYTLRIVALGTFSSR
jgi:hypothetical protein